MIKLFTLKYINLQKIYLRDDPISNKGIKKLMKLDFRSLKELKIANTNITIDSVRVFKRLTPKLTIFGIFQQKLFNDPLIFRNIPHFSNVYESHCLQVMFGFEGQKTSAFSCFNCLSKLKINTKQYSSVRLSLS